MLTADEFHARVLAVIGELVALDPAADSPEGQLLAGLASAVESYEKERYPIAAPTPAEAAEFRTELVHVLLEHIDLGDRLRGVFSTPEKAREAALELRDKDRQRLGSVPDDYLKQLHITTFEVDVLDYP